MTDSAFEVTLPATTPPPAPAEGMVVESEVDVSMYAGSEEYRAFLAAGDDEDARAAALAKMPEATIRFWQTPIETFLAEIGHDPGGEDWATD